MLRALLCAIGFLTRVPVPHTPLTDDDVARSAGFFAWVGALVAAPLAVLAFAAVALGPRITAILLVALWALVTGGLHLDGVADTFDGLGGGRGERARTLDIMRDSRIGAHGAIALALLLALKVAALEPLLAAHSWAWLAVPIVARFGVTALLATFPYARSQGLGSAFAGRVGAREVAIGALAIVAVALWLGQVIAVPACVGALGALALALRMHRLLGGLTGDVHGACLELCEVAMLVGLDLPAR